MQTVHDCNSNPPLNENGMPMNTMLQHQHVGTIEEDLYKEVTVGRSSIDLIVIDWRI